jgi:hypothetical protein
MVMFAFDCYSQTPVPANHPDFRVQVVVDIAADFSARVWSYYDLRSRLQEGLPPPRVTENPAEIFRAVALLAERIRVAREDAKEGDIFTRPISLQFKKVLLLEMTAKTWAVIMDDNPGEFSHRINGTYPKRRPLSTMPYKILTRLPTLPPDIEYRFLGRHLVLHDTRANLILDRIRYAIRCTNCDQ